MLLGGQTTDSQLLFLLIVSYNTLVSAFRDRALISKAMHTLRRWALRVYNFFAWKNGKLLEGKLGGVFRTFRSHLASFNMPIATCLWPCVGVRRAIALIGYAKQAMHGWRKKWSGWNRTNRTGGYGPAPALYTELMLFLVPIKCSELATAKTIKYNSDIFCVLSHMLIA